MGTPPFLDDPDLDIMVKWIEKAERALDYNGLNPLFAQKAAEEILTIWFLGGAQGEAAYLQMVWLEDPDGWKAEHMFWEFAEAKTVQFGVEKYREAYEIMRKGDDVRYDEWGVAL